MGRDAHTVLTPDHVRISLDLYHHGARETVLIICPGFFQSKDTPTFRRLSQALAREHHVIAMDFRGHGRSGGWYTFSAQEGLDLEAVLRWARERYERIGLVGFSLGAAIMIQTVSRVRERVQSLIAVSAPCAFESIELKWWTPDAVRTGLHGLEPGAGCRPGPLWLPKLDPLACVPRLAPVPILFIHGTRDAIVGVDHSRRLYAAASEPKRLEILEGGSHAEALFRDGSEDFCRLVSGWWADTLRHDGSPPRVA